MNRIVAVLVTLMVVSTVNLEASHVSPQKHRQKRDGWSSGPTYCLQPGPGFALFKTGGVPKSLANKFIVFDFHMDLPGTHTLQVFVYCGGLYPRIDLLQGFGVYTLSSSGTGYHGHKCLELYDHIEASENENSFTCAYFNVFFRGHAASGGTHLCVANVVFKPNSALGTPSCSAVAN